MTDVLKGMEVVSTSLTCPESTVTLPVLAYMPLLSVLQLTGHQRAEIPTVQRDSGRYVLDPNTLEAAFVRGKR